MTRLATFALAAVLALSAAAQVKASSPRDEIEAALIAFAQAFNKGDAAGVAGLYAADGAVLPPDAARVDGVWRLYRDIWNANPAETAQ